jgi:D-beta-D-heptose 7-phosphate kinase / D-beta-D-heptose 1-phosphate adenosyltransferase
MKSNKENSIVLVTGVFDILHFEHEKFLKKASELGEVLIVGIESDKRVRQIKGEGRPINIQDKRVENLLSLGVADSVFVLPENFNKPEDHLKLLNKIKPNFLAVSSHTDHLEEKKKLMKKVGGELVVVHDQNLEISSTKMIGSSL